MEFWLDNAHVSARVRVCVRARVIALHLRPRARVFVCFFSSFWVGVDIVTGGMTCYELLFWGQIITIYSTEWTEAVFMAEK